MAPPEKPTPANANREYGSGEIVDDLQPLKSSICVAHMLGVKRGAPCLSSKESATDWRPHRTLSLMQRLWASECPAIRTERLAFSAGVCLRRPYVFRAPDMSLCAAELCDACTSGKCSSCTDALPL